MLEHPVAKSALQHMGTAILVVVCSWHAARCAHAEAPQKSADSPAIAFREVNQSGKTARVKPKWQRLLVKKLQEAQGTNVEAHGLFSYGGWSDNGQRILIITAAREGELYFGKIGSSHITSQQKIVGKSVSEALHTIGSLQNLPDYDGSAFDGIQYEYVYATKVDNVVTIKKRVFMNNPGLDGTGKEHQRAVETFLKLKK